MTLPFFTPQFGPGKAPQPWRSHGNTGHVRTLSNISDLSMRSPTPPSSPFRIGGRKRAQPSPSAVTVNLVTYYKPNLSFTKLIRLALEDSDRGSLFLFEIYEYIRRTWPYFRYSAQGWKNSVRHALSSCRDFVHLPRDPNSAMKGSEWALQGADLASSSQLDSELESSCRPPTPASHAFGHCLADDDLDLMEVALLTNCWMRRDQPREEVRKLKSDVMLFEGSNPSSSPTLNPMAHAVVEAEMSAVPPAEIFKN